MVVDVDVVVDDKNDMLAHEKLDVCRMFHNVQIIDYDHVHGGWHM